MPPAGSRVAPDLEVVPRRVSERRVVTARAGADQGARGQRPDRARATVAEIVERAEVVGDESGPLGEGAVLGAYRRSHRCLGLPAARGAVGGDWRVAEHLARVHGVMRTPRCA